VLAGKRGTFKSLIALDWLMRIALLEKPAVLLSGEGGGLDRRVDAWMRTFAPEKTLSDIPLVALERAINLHTPEVMADLVEAINLTRMQPAIICIDTFSKYTPGLDENSNSEVAAFLAQLGSVLRDRYSATVLLVAHAGHGDAKRPRGASALMANPDSEFIVERVEGTMTVTVSRERYKDSESLPPLAYLAEQIDLERTDAQGDKVTSLVLRQSDGPPPRTRAAGVNQSKALTALREWARANPTAQHITSPEITGLLKTQSISTKRRPEILNYLVNARILTASIGGYTIDLDMLQR
jgi:hypothetical protein